MSVAAAPARTRLPREFYDRGVLELARALLGCTLRHGDTAGTIVETEAYHESEPACHAFAGPTDRARILFGPPGTAYVYRSYGVHSLFNVVCEREGVGAAVLIRALEPLDGLETMRARRPLARSELDLCNGPGKLTEALGIELAHNATSLLDGPIALEPPPPGPEHPAWEAGVRIGITKAPELPWRFCVLGSRWVSRPWPPGVRRRERAARS